MRNDQDVHCVNMHIELLETISQLLLTYTFMHVCQLTFLAAVTQDRASVNSRTSNCTLHKSDCDLACCSYLRFPRS